MEIERLVSQTCSSTPPLTPFLRVQGFVSRLPKRRFGPAPCILSDDDLRSHPMIAADFRRIALSLEGVEEYSHAGLPAFRVGGRKFASLASQAEGYGNLMLTPEQQAAFVEEAPEIFLPIPGGFGRMGHTHIRLAAASEDVLAGALRTAWKIRIDKSAKDKPKKCGAARRINK